MAKSKTDKATQAKPEVFPMPAPSAPEKILLAERMKMLGIPQKEMTESVLLAVSALLEKLDDQAGELAQVKNNFAELERLADVDCLAPVPNRRAFLRRLNWAVAMHGRYGHPCTILYFDLNGFKNINDTYGHGAGDAAIRHVAKLLIDSSRGSDFVARLSGDEFAVIMYYAHFDTARERGRKIVRRLADSEFIWANKRLFLTAAFGAYEVKKGDDAETALANADKAMYLDKKRIHESVASIEA